MNTGWLTAAASLIMIAASHARAEPEPLIDWDVSRVQFEELWPAVHGDDAERRAFPGIALWRRQSWAGQAISDFRNNWNATGDEGFGVSGLFVTSDDALLRPHVQSFGRQGSRISLIIVLRRDGRELPESITNFVRRKRDRKNDNTPITAADITAAQPGARRLLFAGPFPQDLPPGTYQVVVECRDEAGKTLDRYERRLVRAAETPNPLQRLTDDELVREYVTRGEALKGTSIEPIDGPGPGRMAAAFVYKRPDRVAWVETRVEIIRRGKRMVPAIMTLLQAEAVRNPGQYNWSNSKFGMAVDLMDMLGEIKDPRAEQLLIDIVRGMDGKANNLIRTGAVGTLDQLTFLSFRADRNNPASYDSMIGDDPVELSYRQPVKMSEDAMLTAIADRYTAWLNADGRDPEKWLPLARSRARRALRNNDFIGVRNAVAFLTGFSPGYGHDDAPNETIPLLVALMKPEKAEIVGQNQGYLLLPKQLASYGPLARPYVRLMIEQIKARPYWDTYASLAAVGGEAAMAHLVSELPILRQRMESPATQPTADEPSARQRHLAYAGCRWAIERWAGRTFADDAAIRTWWTEAKDKSQEAWLRNAMARTVEAADAGDAKSQALARFMLPDLPSPESDRHVDPPWSHRLTSAFRETPPRPFRVAWLKANASRLAYDSAMSHFFVSR